MVLCNFGLNKGLVTQYVYYVIFFDNHVTLVIKFLLNFV